MAHIASVLFQTSQEQRLLIRSEELGLLREGDDDPVAHGADDDGDQRLDDEEPGQKHVRGRS